jgi:hypothetical protein
MNIMHERFGRGRITDVDTSSHDHKISAFFVEEGVQRTLMLKYARFQILDE